MYSYVSMWVFMVYIKRKWEGGGGHVSDLVDFKSKCIRLSSKSILILKFTIEPCQSIIKYVIVWR